MNDTFAPPPRLTKEQQRALRLKILHLIDTEHPEAWGLDVLVVLFNTIDSYSQAMINLAHEMSGEQGVESAYQIISNLMRRYISHMTDLATMKAASVPKPPSQLN